MAEFTVLIVDDNEMNRDTLARRLRQQGVGWEMAVNGRQALDMLQEHSYQLVLLDIMMPDVDGYTVLATMKSDSNLRHIPVIVISAVEEMDSVMKCMEMGAEDYLTKPFDPELLRVAVERFAQRAGAEPGARSSRPEQPLPPPLPPLKSPTEDFKFDLPEYTTKGVPTNAMTIDEVAYRLTNSGRITRKAYMYLSKAVFTTLFEQRTLTRQECDRLRMIFEGIHAGRIKVVD
ncbi:MAG: response regulator [Oscillatoriales cyanobacterium SM2_2_1]|nr:response regulator [Oscillatoriales cyanobacterium SM2_2_1]